MTLDWVTNSVYQLGTGVESPIVMSGLNGQDFTLTTEENIFFTLSGLERDLDLYVVALDDNGNPLIYSTGALLNAGVSSNPGIEDESIFLRLKPGNWRVYVKENLGANLDDPYKSGNYDYELQIDSQ